jgi:hypothetical protein
MSSSRILAADTGAAHVACGVFAAGPGGKLVLQQFAIERLDANPAVEATWTDQVAGAFVAIAAQVRAGGAAWGGVPGHHAQ